MLEAMLMKVIAHRQDCAVIPSLSLCTSTRSWENQDCKSEISTTCGLTKACKAAHIPYWSKKTRKAQWFEMDTKIYMMALPIFFQLGTLVCSEEEDSYCGDKMSCMSLKECNQGLLNREKGNIFFKCNQEKEKVCCPASELPTARINDTSTTAPIHTKMHLLPDERICGNAYDERITNGQVAALGQFPWMSLLGSRLWNGSLLYICGGTLISDQYILTAAHCLRLLNSSLETVRLGEHDLDTQPDCDKAEEYCLDHVQDFEVENAIPHESFDTRKLKNDIALVRLKNKVHNFTAYVRPICLPFGLNETGKDGKTYTIAGWGKTDFYESRGSPELRFADIYSTPLEVCNPLQAEQVKPLTDTQLCAGGNLGEDVCKGDSGGPLMERVQHPETHQPKYFQVGIVSFGAIPCGAHTSPSVYTRVSKYLSWILDHMEE